MLSDRELSAAIGSTAYDPDGDKIGTVEHFFVDDLSGQPTWVAVTTGLFGTRRSIVPALDAVFTDGALRLPVTRESVRSAPSVGDPEHLEPGDEEVLREHYGAGAHGQPQPQAGQPQAEQPQAQAGQPQAQARQPQAQARQPQAQARQPQAQAAEEPTRRLAGPPEDTPTERLAGLPVPPQAPPGAGTGPQRPSGAPGAGDGAMTRSEERLQTSTETVPATRVRVVRYVVTEEVQVTVPVRREEIRVEEVPFDAPDPGPGEHLVDDDGRHAASGSGTGSDGLPEEIVLHREEPVVGVRVVPFERVRLRTEVVAGQEQVSARLQREQIAVDQERYADQGRSAADERPADPGTAR